MIVKPPTSPAGAARRRDLVELRIANLRRELEAETEPTTQAAILYQVGALYEHELGQASDAMDQYERARAAAPGFQPALVAQLRIAERSKNGHDLDALRSDQVARATSPAISSAALVDLAMHSEDWASLLREAIARSPAPVVPALILEWLAEARGDDGAVRDALRTQAEHAANPDLRAAVWIDIALNEIAGDRRDEAIQALEHACESDALVWQARSLQARTAKEGERWDVFVRASTAMARLLEAAIERDEAQDPSSLSVPAEERRPMAAYLWREAATCCATRLEDPDAAASYIASALRLLPDHRVARLEALLVAERGGNEAAIEETTEWFRAAAADDAAFVAHELRLAMSSDDVHRASETVREAAARFPDSVYAQAALEVALIRGRKHAVRADAFRASADAAEGEPRARLLWHAAQLSVASEESADRVQALYSAAIEASTESTEAIAREALGAAIVAKRSDWILERCDELLRSEIEPDERTTLEHCKYELAQRSPGSNEEAQRLLAEALLNSNNRCWAPQLARAQAAWSGNNGLLARAHEEIAGVTSEEEARAGHLCAAGQAYARNLDWEAAERVLRRALDAAPDDRYIVSLLDTVLREGGRPDEVVTLARERSQADSSAALGELSLLLAGAAAERGGNLTAARRAYEQALADAPGSLSAALALLDIGRRQDDREQTLRAYEELSQSEVGGGVPELFALLRGDALGSSHEAGASEAYEQALEHPVAMLAAAIALLSMPSRLTTADQRSAAEEALSDAGPSTQTDANGFATAYGGLRASLGEEGAFAGDAWLRLAASAPTEGLLAGALLQGLRATSIARGPDAADEIFLLAQEAEGLSGIHAEAAIAIDEALAPADDTELRIHALEQRLHHSESIGRSALEAAYCRTLVEADRGADAVALLSSAVDERPDDLALWESLRSAARRAEQWPLVAQGCERLAPFVEGSLRADLLEEAGVVRMDCLAQYQQAEDLFRRALDEDPTRDIAFRRLRDLLVAQEDAEALEVLVSERLALGGPKDRLDLLYERARLLRGISDRPGALEVLGELFTSEPDHAGALALAAEVHVSLEQWAEAVDCLRRLSKASIPADQRRVAHLGAADFLEAQLGAKDEALEELRAVETLGLADAPTWTRIGALEAELGDPGAAIVAYRKALEAEPTNEIAMSGLVELLDEADRDPALAAYERAIWKRIEVGKLDESLLEALRRAAGWRGQTERTAAGLAVQAALGLAEPGRDGSADLDQVSIAAIWDPNADSVLQEVLLHAGPSLTKNRQRAKKANPNDPVFAELQRIAQRFGGRTGSIGFSDQLATLIAHAGRDGEIDWIVPPRAQAGLDARERFIAGRLAWAVPHGGAQLLDDSVDKAAGTLAAILRVSRCEVAAAEPSLPTAEVKLPRSVRKAVRQTVGDIKLDPSALLAFARSLQRSADRAGVLASGEIAAALAVVLGGRLNLDALRTSTRGLDVLRFWLDAESPLWGGHG